MTLIVVAHRGSEPNTVRSVRNMFYVILPEILQC